MLIFFLKFCRPSFRRRIKTVVARILLSLSLVVVLVKPFGFQRSNKHSAVYVHVISCVYLAYGHVSKLRNIFVIALWSLVASRGQPTK